MLPLLGMRVPLPLHDVTGAPVAAGTALTMIVLPGCNSCSFTSDGEAKIPPASGRTLYVTPDATRLAELRRHSRKHGAQIAIDDGRLLPQRLYDNAPLVIRLDGTGTVVGGGRWP